MHQPGAFPKSYVASSVRFPNMLSGILLVVVNIIAVLLLEVSGLGEVVMNNHTSHGVSRRGRAGKRS